MNHKTIAAATSYVHAHGNGDKWHYSWLTSPDIERAADVDGETYNEAFYCGLIAQVIELPPNAKTTIRTSNQTVVNQVNGNCQTHEDRLIPLVDKVRALLEERPGVKIAFMPKSELVRNVRRIKAEIIKREAGAAVNPDDSASVDNNGVCPW